MRKHSYPNVSVLDIELRCSKHSTFAFAGSVAFTDESRIQTPEIVARLGCRATSCAIAARRTEGTANTEFQANNRRMTVGDDESGDIR
jgi:hypothetical protein